MDCPRCGEFCSQLDEFCRCGEPLKEQSPKKKRRLRKREQWGSEVRVSWLGTLILSSFYLQYKINRLPEHTSGEIADTFE